MTETLRLPEIRMLAVDLDGTLLDARKQISTRTVEGLKHAIAKGVRVVIASARPPRSVRSIYEALGLTTLQINYNGALIWDEERRAAVFHRPLKGQIVREMVELARDYHDEVIVHLEVLDRWCTDRTGDAYATETGRLFKPDQVAELNCFFNEPVTKLMFLGDPRMISKLEALLLEQFAERVTILRTDDELLQVMHPRAGKAAALKRLATHYDVPLAQVMAVGDAPNDVGMIQLAGVGVAMGNAAAVVKEVADWIAAIQQRSWRARGAGSLWIVRMTALPYLTDFAGIGGTIKNRVEDFFVQEIPLYEPSGEGEHVYVEIQKAGITTFEALRRLARALRVNHKDIGYSGLKDAKAVTRQVFSIAGVTESAVMNAYLSDMTVQWAARHRNKLRIGHLAGNRFAVKIRDVQPTDVIKLRPVISEMERRGMPNYFGEQRFGRNGNNHLLGAALIAGDDLAALRLLLGEACETKDLNAVPQGLERRVLQRYIKTGNASTAIGAVDEKIRRLWVSALQSSVFNQVVASRIQSLDQLMDGDLAFLHESGACFRVQSAAVEQPRCERF